MSETFVLIPGRTSDQGCGISEGKALEKYQTEITTLRVAPQDMESLKIEAGDRVRVMSEHGKVDVRAQPARPDELPSGVLFIAYGDASSHLMGADTHGPGMPTSKGIDVTLEVVRSGA